MASSRAGRVVILVLDALGPEFVDAARMPWLSRLADRGAIAPLGGVAELVASTGPNHATLLTGAALAGHGVLANRVFARDGTIDSDPRVRIPTVLDRASPVSSKLAFSTSARSPHGYTRPSVPRAAFSHSASLGSITRKPAPPFSLLSRSLCSRSGVLVDV